MNPFSLTSLQDGDGAAIPMPIMSSYRDWFEAAENGVLSTLQALRPQVDINAAISLGTALAVAAAHRQGEVVDYLIERGANVNARGKSQKGLSLTPLLAVTAHNHAKGAAPGIIGALLNAGANVNAAASGTGNTALLYLAISHGTPDLLGVVSQLINAGADLNLSNRLGQTPLHRAAGNAFLGENVGERVKVLHLLIDSGARMDLPDMMGHTALFYALTTPPHLTQLLLKKGFNPNHQDLEGKTSLMHAASNHRYRQEHIQMLLDHNANPASFDGSGTSTWHYLARCPDLNPKLLDRLLGLSGPIPSTPNARGETVLGVAAGHSQPDMVVLRWLLDNGCRADQVDANGASSALKASEKGAFAAYDLLVERGADPCGKDASGKSVLHHAVLHPNLTALEQAVSHRSLLDIQDNTGMTAMHCAARSQNFSFLRLLLAVGANPTLATPEGHLPEGLIPASSVFRQELESYRERYQLEDSLRQNGMSHPSPARTRL